MMTDTTVALVDCALPEPVRPCRIVAADHPALDRGVEEFLAALGTERRSRSLVQALVALGGFRLAAVACGRLVGLARVDPQGELHISVLVAYRGSGIGTLLGKASLERAAALDYSRVTMHTNRRSRSARLTGEAAGCLVVENARGRTDLIAHLPTRLYLA